MKKLFIFIAVSLFTFHFSICRAQEWQDNQWCNGYQMLIGEQLNKSQVLLVGNGFCDAGYGYLFNIKKTGEGSYDLTSAAKPMNMPKGNNDIDEIARSIIKNDTYNSDFNLKWKRKEVGGSDILLEYNNDGKLTSMYALTGYDLKEHACNKIMELFCGGYKDAQGRTWSFGIYQHECRWAGKETHYQMDEQLGSPYFAIKVNGKLYALELTMKGMDIYEAKPDENQSFYKHIRLVASLTADKSMPRFSDASVHPCDSYAISQLKPNVIRLIRNEIYARHGWVFKDAQLNKYFRSLSWYEPKGNNSQIKLSEIELLNVALLKYYEDLSK